MYQIPFYHEIIKKLTIGFGALFSQVKLIRRSQDGTDAQIISVPIAFGPKEKFITRLEQDPSLTGHTYITLPRMAFEIVGYTYDASRKINRNNKIQCVKDGDVIATYTPAPYNIDIQLNILTKGVEDGLAIIEQILPTFTPEYSFTINVLPEMEIQQDIPLTLNSVNVSDDYEGDFGTRRLVTHTLSFTAKVNLFGSMTSNGAIMRTETDLKSFQNHTAVMDDDGNIIVDVWNSGTRQSMTRALSSSVSASVAASVDIPAEVLLSASVSVAASVAAPLDLQNETESSILGSVGDGYYIEQTPNTDLGAGDFSLEAFVNVSSFDSELLSALGGRCAVITKRVSDNVGPGTWCLYIDRDPSGLTGTLSFSDLSDFIPTLTSPAGAIPLNAWTHVAICRIGTVISLYINGARVSTNTSTDDYTSNNITFVKLLGNFGGIYPDGGGLLGGLPGKVSYIRLNKGVSLYDANSGSISVPTSPLTPQPQTTLLIRGATDISGEGNILVKYQNPVLSDGPF